MDRRRLGQIVSGAVFLAVCAVAVLIVLSQAGGGSGGDTHLENVRGANEQLRGIPQRGTVLGDPGADVALVEYADLQCPVCAVFFEQTVPGLIDGVIRDGVAKYDLRQFTILGPESETAAKAALAAGEQGRYWNFVDLFYRNQGQEGSGYVTDAFLTEIAEGAGVPDMEKWESDRQSPRWDATLARVQTEANSLGIRSTPTFVVTGPGGQRVVGSGLVSLSDLEDAIRAVE